MRTRILLLVVAIALGGTAAVLAARYLNDARSSIEAEAEAVEVLVAQDDIPRGLSAEDLIERKLVVRQAVPARYVSAGAVSSPRSIEGQVLSAPLSKGEQVTSGRFQYPSAAGLAYSVPDDYVAISIPVDETRGVAGLVKPGDQVMVVATLELEKDGEKEKITKVLVPQARVLAVGLTTGTESAPEEEQEGGLVGAGSRASNAKEVPSTYTLALPPSDVERLVFSEETGSVWLALLGANAPELQKTTGQSMQTVLR